MTASIEPTFLACCGSRRWAEAMTASLPFASRDARNDAATRIWNSLTGEDYLEAFAAHPKIGERTTDQRAAAEQSGAAAASAETRAELDRLNRDYKTKFGYIFIICATGKTAGEMLDALRQRLNNSAEAELAIAAREQLAITLLRLAKIDIL